MRLLVSKPLIEEAVAIIIVLIALLFVLVEPLH